MLTHFSTHSPFLHKHMFTQVELDSQQEASKFWVMHFSIQKCDWWFVGFTISCGPQAKYHDYWTLELVYNEENLLATKCSMLVGLEREIVELKSLLLLMIPCVTTNKECFCKMWSTFFLLICNYIVLLFKIIFSLG